MLNSGFLIDETDGDLRQGLLRENSLHYGSHILCSALFATPDTKAALEILSESVSHDLTDFVLGQLIMSRA